MLHLKELRTRMFIKGIPIDGMPPDIAVEILDLQWQSPDELVVTCQDPRKRLYKVILTSSDKCQLQCTNVFSLPWKLLPQSPGQEEMRVLTKAEKGRLNQSLFRAGFVHKWDKDGGYSDWTHTSTTYRIFHANSHQSFIVLLEPEATTSAQQKPQTALHHDIGDLPKLTPPEQKSPPTTTADFASHPTPHPYLAPGMYVRIPFDLVESPGEYRDYRIGQLVDINSVANSARIKLQTYSPGQPVAQEIAERDIAHIHRCHILPETLFIHAETKQTGQVLLPCLTEWEEGKLCDYYVEITGQIKRLSEEKILVASHRQSPHPLEQLKRYELHHPRWKTERDQLIESYAELHAATYGLEDLVGSRIMLLPHQAEVVATVLSDETCRYILADEVGLGKTIETCVIIKGLSRRHPGLKTLIVAPASLVEQWHFELNNKFWLDFVRDDQLNLLHLPKDCPGIIVSTEKLSNDGQLTLWLSMQEWGLLIVDEAHHLHKRPSLYERIYQLSSDAERALILSATPIQRRGDEYLALLKLMYPERYSALTHTQFSHILQAQQTLRQTIAYLAQALTPDDFDLAEFLKEMELITDKLKEDEVLQQLVTQAAAQTCLDAQLKSAKEAISYVSENYRIESRMIRNRRVNLNIELPKRDVDTSFSYLPEATEVELLNQLHDYIDFMLTELKGETKKSLGLEYCRVLLHKAFSSPHSLESLLKERQKILHSPQKTLTNAVSNSLLTLAPPRQEAKRIQTLLTVVPVLAGESDWVNNLLWLCGNWREQTDTILESYITGRSSANSGHRLVRVLRAIQNQLQKHPASKIVVFSAWTETLLALLPHLTKHLRARRGRVAQFHCQIPSEDLQEQADLFQSQDDYHILLCDELGGEGRNFQIADVIVHIDIPWTPAQLEQRIGRVDRLGRTGKVVSIVSYAHEQIEQDLFRIWEDGFNLFTHSMSGLEIALESVLDDLLSAMEHNSRDSLINLLPAMLAKAKELRKAVEEERYFEENAINHRQRDEFQKLSEKYRDGSKLGRSFTSWASMAGLENSYNRLKDTVMFFPKKFNQKSMVNAKFVTPPNMEEALRRSGRTHNLVITGTFNRDVAVQREDLVFFAPGNDPWTDGIVRNALEADRGRSCAILRKTDLLATPWQGVELLYQIQVNPRPLYKAGHSPIHLFQAQGYLFLPTYRVLVSVDGDVITRSHPAWEAITTYSFSSSYGDIHLGKRSGPRRIVLLKEAFPPDIWEDVLVRAVSAANTKLMEEFDFTLEVAEEAAEDFERKLLGLRASRYWFNQIYGPETIPGAIDLEAHQQIANGLIEGIRHPLIQLESACFWWLCPTQDYESLLQRTTRIAAS
ncbi:MAG: DEAD/DEAH box helicase family protein [Chloroflexi bacterium]|nr:DEAD/DEAH box helicase family protein [Chloroflexota bacterium]